AAPEASVRNRYETHPIISEQEGSGNYARGTTGKTMRDGRLPSWKTVWVATTQSAIHSSPNAFPVFRFRSKQGKFELETSTRIRCPARNRLLVDPRSTRYSHTSSGVSSLGLDRESR